MQTALPVSCFIIAKNESDRIGQAIRSVRDWVDEVVVVVDSSSTDNTNEIARSFGATVVENAWPGYGLQKRFAEDLCRSDWLLNLDADEAATPALAKEIQALFAAGEPAAAGYRIFIAEMFPFEAKPAYWAHGQWQIRLYDRRKGRFSDSPVHDTVRPVDGARIAKLKGVIDHRSNTSISFTVEKINRYSDAQVADMRTRGRPVGWLRLFAEFPLAFLKAYFLRLYFLRGGWGWISAINYAFFRHLRVAKTYEAELMEKVADSDVAHSENSGAHLDYRRTSNRDAALRPPDIP